MEHMGYIVDWRCRITTYDDTGVGSPVVTLERQSRNGRPAQQAARGSFLYEGAPLRWLRFGHGIPSGKLTKLWKLFNFIWKTHYFDGHSSIAMLNNQSVYPLVNLHSIKIALENPQIFIGTSTCIIVY